MIAYINCNLYSPSPDPETANYSDTISTNILGDKLNIYYQNVHGLILFTELNKSHPNLDNTKLCELHAYSYIYDKCPDIIVLNETWLIKASILEDEILPSNKYKIFRWTERTSVIHQIPITP